MGHCGDAGTEAVRAHPLGVLMVVLLQHGLHDHLEPLLASFGGTEICPCLFTGPWSPAKHSAKEWTLVDLHCLSSCYCEHEGGSPHVMSGIVPGNNAIKSPTPCINANPMS